MSLRASLSWLVRTFGLRITSLFTAFVLVADPTFRFEWAIRGLYKTNSNLHVVNPLLERVISIFDTNKDNEIEFSEFISALSTFSDKDNKEGKLKCTYSLSLRLSNAGVGPWPRFGAFLHLLNISLPSHKANPFCLKICDAIVAFQVYDIDGDGFISNGELFQVLKMMVGDNLNDVQLQQIVDKTILEGDEDKDGRISFEEFKAMITGMDDIHEKMSLSWAEQP